MLVKSMHRNARISPLKARIVANIVRGMNAEKAQFTLDYSPQKAAKMLGKVLKSALSNAEHNHNLDVDGMKIHTIEVNEARSLKRISPRAKGRADRIVKRNSHLTIILAEAQE